MKHSTRCANAETQRSKCKCSCKGELHGCNVSGAQTKSKLSKVLNNPTTKTIATAAIVVGVAPVCPAIVPVVYKGYCTFKFGKKLCDACNKKDIDIDKIITESSKHGTTEVSEKISENKASQIAKDVRLAAGDIIGQVSKETKVDEETYGLMLEGSVKKVILSGVNTIASYTLESL